MFRVLLTSFSPQPCAYLNLQLGKRSLERLTCTGSHLDLEDLSLSGKTFSERSVFQKRLQKNPSHPLDIILVIYVAFYFDYKTSTQDNVSTVLMLQGFRKW